MCMLMEIEAVVAALPGITHPGRLPRVPAGPAPAMDVLMVFGFLCAFVTLVCWVYRHQAGAFMLALAAGLAGLAVYGFLERVWLLGMVQMVFSVMVLRQWNQSRNRNRRKQGYLRRRQACEDRALRRAPNEDRLSRLFGSIDSN